MVFREGSSPVTLVKGDVSLLKMWEVGKLDVRYHRVEYYPVPSGGVASLVEDALEKVSYLLLCYSNRGAYLK